VPEDSAAGSGGPPDLGQPRPRPNRTITPAVAGALVVLAASFALSVAFVLANGGLSLPGFSPAPSGAEAGADTPAPAGSAFAEASPSPEVSPVASPTVSGPTPTPTPAAAESPSATAATPTPAAATPRPSSDRYRLLTACPDKPDCWIYVVRQGDNLFSIARYFGVPLAAVQEANPWTNNTPLVAGQKLRLPPPTR
jgi:LysM repeat protein